MLLHASEFGSETAISKARAELAAAERDSDSWTYRYRIEELCQLLFDTIGMQLSIHPPYLAKNPERGAVLDTIDCPLNNRVWMEAQFREILALKDTAAQTWRLTSIAKLGGIPCEKPRTAACRNILRLTWVTRLTSPMCCGKPRGRPTPAT